MGHRISLATILFVLLATPLAFYVVGKVLNVPSLVQLGGYSSVLTATILILVATSSFIYARYSATNPKKKSERVASILSMLRSEPSYRLSFHSNKVSYVVRWNGDSFLQADNGRESVITKEDLTQRLNTADDFPRISKAV